MTPEQWDARMRTNNRALVYSLTLILMLSAGACAFCWGVGL